MIVTIRHCKQIKFCSPGVRRWFNSQGLDFKDFLRNGIAEEKLLATGDALALEVVKAANVKR